MSPARLTRSLGALLTAGALVALATTAAAAAPPVAPSPAPGTDVNADPGPKRNAPAQNLKNYPKLPAPSAEDVQKPNPKIEGDGSSKSVVSITKRPDGGTEMIMYSPAHGVTPEQLVEMLHQQGDHNAKVVEHDEADPAAPRAPGGGG